MNTDNQAKTNPQAFTPQVNGFEPGFFYELSLQPWSFVESVVNSKRMIPVQAGPAPLSPPPPRTYAHLAQTPIPDPHAARSTGI